MYRILIIIVLTILVSCSVQRRLQKSYIGKPQSVLSEKFGYPKTVFDKGSEKIYVYEIIKDLKSTEINQAKLTLDPMISPSVQKTVLYYFTVKEETITNVKVEEEYNR